MADKPIRYSFAYTDSDDSGGGTKPGFVPISMVAVSTAAEDGVVPAPVITEPVTLQISVTILGASVSESVNLQYFTTSDYEVAPSASDREGVNDVEMTFQALSSEQMGYFTQTPANPVPLANDGTATITVEVLEGAPVALGTCILCFSPQLVGSTPVYTGMGAVPVLDTSDQG